MTNLNSRQKIAKRKRISTPTESTESLFSPVRYLKNKSSFFRKADSREKVLIISAAVLSVVCIIAGTAGFLMDIRLDENAFILPEENPAINLSLLEYASPEFEGMGSGGLIEVPEVSIITGVSSFDYTVQEGDTLSEISNKYNIDVGTLISFNKIENVRRIWVGSKLKIPDIDGLPYVVKKGDTLDSIAEDYKVPLNDILDANNLESEIIAAGDQLFIPGAKISDYEYKKATGTLFIYPVTGRLSSPYGYRIDPFTGVRRMHYGLDIANRVGTGIKATMEGTVVVVADQPLGYGQYVVIRHERGFQSLYGHLNKILVRKGQYVRQGQVIGEMGNTGRSTGPHLHFSLYKNNIPVNPMNGYLYR